MREVLRLIGLIARGALIIACAPFVVAAVVLVTSALIIGAMTETPGAQADREDA